MRFFWKVVLVLFISVGFGFGSDLAQAGPQDRLLPLLVNVKGWNAAPAKGNNMEGVGRNGRPLKVITAQRTYKKGKMKADVTVIINSGSQPENQVKEFSLNSGSMTMKTTKVDNFWVSTTFNKTNNAGQALVSLAHNDDTHALLSLGFVNMTPEDAVEFAKQFKWKVLQKETARIL